MKLWPHQSNGIVDTSNAMKAGRRRITFVAPPGAGKSVVMKEIAEKLIENNLRLNIYLHRRMLTRQTIGHYESSGIDFGVVACDFESYANPKALIQICSMQTVAARKDKWNFDFPDCDYFFVDEKHQQLGDSAESVFLQHIERGAREIAFTATPVGLGPSTCQELVTPCNYSDLLVCGAHLPVETYCPDMPSFNRLEAEISEQKSDELNSPGVIIGSVFNHWKRLNPSQLPTILFAPSVAASAWYCEEFAKLGISSCHIDASKSTFSQYDEATDSLVVRSFETTDDTRREVIEGSRTGKYKIICNRFILREAIDMPWLYHGICATTFGGLASYLQASGRILRNYSRYDHVVWQDHGGNIYRHGLINEDREWEIGSTDRVALANRKKEGVEAETQEKVEGILCPRCGRHRKGGPECPGCGHASKRGTRVVRELDGTLKKVSGRFFKRKPEPSARKEFTAAMYVHRAMYKKNRAPKDVSDVIRHAINRCRKAGIKTSWHEMESIANSVAKKPVAQNTDFRAAFFPEEI